MKDNEFAKEELARLDYQMWKNTRKEFFPVEFHNIRVDGKVEMPVRVGDHSIRIGDCMGGATVLRIQAYGKELEETGAGLTCWLTLDRMPYFTVLESYQEDVKQLKEMRQHDDRAGVS